MKKTRVKTLGKDAMLRNINGLSVGDKAYCGPYGTVTCTVSAKNSWTGKRTFKVTGSTKDELANGGNWTYAGIRKAVMGA